MPARLATFAAALLVALGAVTLFDWWIDPYADRYRSGPLRVALGRSEPCFVSESVVGARSWPALKLDIVRRRHADVVVVGTSRALTFEALRPRERFANAALPGLDVSALVTLFERLDAIHPRPLTVYLAVDPWWFGDARIGPPVFEHPVLDRLRQLVSGETFRAAVAVVRRAPGSIRHPGALRAWEIHTTRLGCVVDDPGGAAVSGIAGAWSAAGAFYNHWVLNRLPPPQPGDFVASDRGVFVAKRLSRERIRRFTSALDFARRHGWRLVAFSPPFSRSGLARLEADPGTAPLLRAFRARVPRLVRARGFPFVDWTDPRAVPCSDAEIPDHGHPDATCARRERARLDAVARRLRPPRPGT